MTDNRCKIWPEFEALRVSERIWRFAFYVLGSPRAGGDYQIDESAADWCEVHNDLDSLRVKARLTTWVIDNQADEGDAQVDAANALCDGGPAPLITRELIQQLLSSPKGTPVPVRCDRLLRKLTSYPSPIIDIMQSENTLPELLAWSESVDVGELTHLLSMLRRDGFVHPNGQSISVTDAGHQHIRDLDDEPRARIGF